MPHWPSVANQDGGILTFLINFDILIEDLTKSKNFCGKLLQKNKLYHFSEKNIFDVRGTLNEIGLFVRNFEKTEDFFIINHILLLYYIYVRKCYGSLPSLRGFIARIRLVYNIELHIAREKNKLTTHFKKWEK